MLQGMKNAIIEVEILTGRPYQILRWIRWYSRLTTWARPWDESAGIQDRRQGWGYYQVIPRRNMKIWIRMMMTNWEGRWRYECGCWRRKRRGRLRGRYECTHAYASNKRWRCNHTCATSTKLLVEITSFWIQELHTLVVPSTTSKMKRRARTKNDGSSQ